MAGNSSSPDTMAAAPAAAATPAAAAPAAGSPASTGTAPASAGPVSSTPDGAKEKAAETASAGSQEKGAAETEAPARGRVVKLVANSDLAWGDDKYPAGTVMAMLVLPPGVPYDVRYVTRLVEDCHIRGVPGE